MRTTLSAGGWNATFRLAAVCALVGATLALAAPAAAESTWVDGSPPPEDFGVQSTAPQAGVSAYNWLYSTDGGAAVYASWTTQTVDRSQLDGLSGGVATGMTTAGAARR
jgi:hypothetical protein